MASPNTLTNWTTLNPTTDFIMTFNKSQMLEMLNEAENGYELLTILRDLSEGRQPVLIRF